MFGITIFCLTIPYIHAIMLNICVAYKERQLSNKKCDKKKKTTETQRRGGE